MLNILYRSRGLVLIATLLFLVYANVYMWQFIPFADFQFHWRPDSRLRIRLVPSDSLASDTLQAGDIVTAIDDNPVYRGRILYTVPVKPTYLYSVERNGKRIEVPVSFLAQAGTLAVSYRLPMGILTITFWVVGAIILYFAQRENVAALNTGYLFVLTSVVTMGTHATLPGVPYAWVWRPFLYAIGVGYIYLGYLPRAKPLSDRSRRLFKWLYSVAGLLGLLAFFEAAVLFPQQSSVQDLAGISLYALAFFLGGLGWVVGFLILVFRAWQMEATYERQQVGILIYLTGLAILPVTFLTLLPRALWDFVILPFPIAILLFSLVPLGYLFVIYRRGFLGLDIVFSRSVIFITLALAMVVIYSAGLIILQRTFFVEDRSNVPSVLMLLPTLALSIYFSRPINRFVYGVFFGREIEHTLPLFTSALSLKPEVATLETILVRLGEELNCAKGLLVLNNENGRLAAAAQRGSIVWTPIAQSRLTPFWKPLLRSAIRPTVEMHPLLEQYSWMELVLPIIVRDEQIGFWALSRPQPDGYFHAEQVRFLERVAEIIAVSSEAIYLFNASRKQSLRLLSAQDDERKRLASMLHDSPLQTLTFVVDKIDTVANTARACQNEAADLLKEQVVSLHQAAAELREICIGLYPPVIEMGVEVVVEVVSGEFAVGHGLQVETQIALEKTFADKLDVGTAVYRVMVESLNNIVKHANSTSVLVQLQGDSELLTLTVTDDGIGSSLPALSLSELLRRQHLGVVGMFEWASWIGGTLRIAHNAPQGTQVRLQIPMRRP